MVLIREGLQLILEYQEEPVQSLKSMRDSLIISCKFWSFCSKWWFISRKYRIINSERSGRHIVTDVITAPVANTSAYFFQENR
ncbi:hypothetical protein L1987_30031 [Smallanthus sonchifolius]|uniref:Uncharacterized protein n=1 Tax=Smallanthus sonchifolius TaxID=185202 RepID=A0ACB9I1L8_9ASTR|nr:hypothetical protein L1987_30031 [Smallanthus sonchifolius]